MNIIGFDPSLNSSGWACKEDGEVCTGTSIIKNLRGVARLYRQRERFIELVEGFDLVVYEDYAMGIKGGRSFSIGELGGVLKLHCYDVGIAVLLVPPTSLKMFATGNGAAKKEQMIQTMEDKHGVELATDDEADALALLDLGEAYLSNRVARQYSPKQRSAFDGCTYTEGSIING